MSQLRSIPAPSLMSQLIHPFGGSVPQPQLRRRIAGSDTNALPAELLDQPPQHVGGVEVLLGDLPRGAAVPVRIRPYLLDRADRLFEGREGDQALAAGEVGAESGLLGDDRLPAGEIAGAAIAEPAASGVDVHAFGHAELSGGTLDEATVGNGVARGRGRIEQ